MKNVTESQQTFKKNGFFGGLRLLSHWAVAELWWGQGVQMRRSTVGQAAGAGKWHKGARSPGIILQGVQVGCTCRLVPSNSSWMGCKDGLESSWNISALLCKEISQLGIPQPESAQGHQPLVQVDFPRLERGQRWGSKLGIPCTKPKWPLAG